MQKSYGKRKEGVVLLGHIFKIKLAGKIDNEIF